ncbi:biotin/lipoyl-binding protein [Lamprobacter modestohalophilus]|uniref:HlyD family secretion protein n=1 Tax=Lamprobacter modestohalophilus TaxID=1064514 RepID=UPI002ADED80D|nr:biotin/lipoyl-binding protein [Lamprobacter modestohalophilus]MEA1052034.1 biotin/lipoyl-binding protein [Lamprobacter modestohalophilus]
MLELLLCSLLTVFPDYLFRRYVQGKRFGHEITLFSVWYELRYGITLCLVLTVSLITTIFYFHPSTTAAASVFRTVTILPEITGRVEETYVGISQKVKEGDPLFRLDSSEFEADVETAEKRIAEIDAELAVARSKLAEAEARIAQARGGLKQAQDEFDARADVQRRSPGSVAKRDVERFETQVMTQQAAVDAASAVRDTLLAQLEEQLPAQRETAVAALHEAQVELDKTLVVAGTDGVVQQFTLRPGDLVNALLRPAGILVPDRKVDALLAGFGQIESKVIKEGMVGEVTCLANPWQIIPVLVTEVQEVIANGQVRPTDRLFDVKQFATPGTITALLEPLYAGQFDDLPQGASCIANVYTSNHDRLQSDDLTSLQRLGLHAIDTVGVVHAMILRMQALLLPVKTLVLTGH